MGWEGSGNGLGIPRCRRTLRPLPTPTIPRIPWIPDHSKEPSTRTPPFPGKFWKRDPKKKFREWEREKEPGIAGVIPRIHREVAPPSRCNSRGSSEAREFQVFPRKKKTGKGDPISFSRAATPGFPWDQKLGIETIPIPCFSFIPRFFSPFIPGFSLIP